MNLARSLSDDRVYPGPPHVVERLHRGGIWIPVALGIRAHDTEEALAAYRSCLPPNVWTRVTFRARLQEIDSPTHGRSSLAMLGQASTGPRAGGE